MIPELTIATMVALLISLGMNRVMLRVAPILGLMDEPGERRIHTQVIPRAGGIAIWLTFMAVVGGGLATGLLHEHGHVSWRWLLAFGAGSAVLMIAGFFDDRDGLSAWVKLGAHILAPLLCYWLYPFRIGLFPDHWPWACDAAMFVIWAVLLINAFNLIDGLDGLCGGLAAVATFALSGLAMINQRFDSAMLMLVMGGAILGFLKYNLNPARIFLGDAGSMLLGFFLATSATEAVGRKAVAGMILLPIAIAGVPLMDVLLAIWRRGARRMFLKLNGEQNEGGIFEADKEHLHHRLLHSTGSQHKVALVMQGIAILLATLAFLPMIFGQRMMALSLVGFLVILMAGLRHLARVEIERTGNVVHMAIKLPGHRRRMATTMFVYDCVVLAAAGAAAVMIESNRLIRAENLDHLVRFVIVFMVLGSIVLLVTRVHQRLWVRASMRDLVALQFWLLLAAMATFTLFTLVYASLEWSALRMMLISYVFACLGICLPRVAIDLLRDFGMESRFSSHRAHAAESYGPVVVLGAGDLGTLWLSHLKYTAHDDYPGMRLLGFLDESRILHGRRIRTYRILGDLGKVPELVRDQGLKGIVVAINDPPQELLDRLAALADAHDLKIYRWRVAMEEC